MQFPLQLKVHDLLELFKVGAYTRDTYIFFNHVNIEVSNLAGFKPVNPLPN